MDIGMSCDVKGLLLVNEYLNTKKFSEHAHWLLEAAKKNGITMEVKTNAEILPMYGGSSKKDRLQQEERETNNIYLNPSKNVEENLCVHWNKFDSANTVTKQYRKDCNDSGLDWYMEYSKECYKMQYGELPDFVLFWDKDIRLAQYLEGLGIPVFNSSTGILNCDDKSITQRILCMAGIKMPRTIFAPMTFLNIGYTQYQFLELVMRQLSFPMVVKECFGSFGAQVYLCNDEEELLNRVKQIHGKPMLFQEFIHFSAGKDLRLQVVGNQVVAAMYRYSDHGDFRANISNGGKMKPYQPSIEECDLAVKVCRLLSLDFAGVDLLFAPDGNCYVCEVNSNAHFKNIYDCTRVNTADFIMKYLASIHAT